MQPTPGMTPATPAVQAAPAWLEGHQISIQVGLTVHKGQMFVGQHALYFVSSNSGSFLWSAVGGLVGGGVGALITQAGPRDASGQPAMVTEAQVYEAAINSGGMVFEPAKIELIKHGIIMRLIRYEGKRFPSPSGFPKALRKQIGTWALAHGVATKRMK